MKKQPGRHRVIALIVAAAFILAALQSPQPAWADEGGLARAAAEAVLGGLKSAYNSVKAIFKSEDAAVDVGRAMEGLFQKKTELAAAKRQLTEAENKLNGFKEIADTIDRNKEAVEHLKTNVLQDQEEAARAKKEGEENLQEWERVVKQLLADRDRVEQRVSAVLARPDPPACSFMGKKIRHLRDIIKEYQTQYLSANEQARMSAAYALVHWKVYVGIWGTVILSIVALWSNIVTSLAIVADAVTAVRTLWKGLIGALEKGWGLLSAATSKLDAVWMKFEGIMTDSKALKAFLEGAATSIGELFDLLIEKAAQLLGVIVDKIAKAGQLLKDFFVRDAWAMLKTLWDDVRQINSIGQAGKLAVTKAQEAYRAGKQKASDLLHQYNEATEKKVDAVNFAATAVESVKTQVEKVNTANDTAADYARKAVRVVDDLTIQWSEYQDKIKEVRTLRQDILRAQSEFEISQKQMVNYVNMLTEAIGELEKLLQTKCINTASGSGRTVVRD